MLKKLKSLFIVEEKSSDKSQEDKASSNAKSSQTGSTSGSQNKPKANSGPKAHTPTANQKSKTASGSATGAVKKKFTDILLKAMDDSNKEGFDYIEFKTSLQSLMSVDMDDKTRFNSALAMAKSMGATKDKLITSANHYINTLKQEERKFNDAVKSQSSRQIDQKKQEIQDIDKGISEKRKMLDKLIKEIEAEEQRKVQLNVDLKGAAQKIAQTQGDFGASLDQILSQINGDIDNMKKYLA